jgi:hypothetical protein
VFGYETNAYKAIGYKDMDPMQRQWDQGDHHGTKETKGKSIRCAINAPL